MSTDRERVAEIVERMVLNLSEREPTAETIDAQELLAGTPLESLHCISTEELIESLTVTLSNMVHDGEVVLAALRGAQEPPASETLAARRQDGRGDSREAPDASVRGSTRSASDKSGSDAGGGVLGQRHEGPCDGFGFNGDCSMCSGFVARDDGSLLAVQHNDEVFVARGAQDEREPVAWGVFSRPAVKGAPEKLAAVFTSRRSAEGWMVGREGLGDYTRLAPLYAAPEHPQEQPVGEALGWEITEDHSGRWFAYKMPVGSIVIAKTVWPKGDPGSFDPPYRVVANMGIIVEVAGLMKLEGARQAAQRIATTVEPIGGASSREEGGADG